MIPISRIKKGDGFKSRNYVSNLAWVVIDVDAEERLVHVEALDIRTCKVIRSTWLKNTHEIFDEAARIEV